MRGTRKEHFHPTRRLADSQSDAKTEGVPAQPVHGLDYVHEYIQ